MRILVATPAYQFQVHSMMMRSFMQMRDYMKEKGHEVDWYTITSSALAYSRNMAAEASKTYDYLYFWDADIDIAEIDFLEKMIEVSETNGSDVVVVPYLMKGEPPLYCAKVQGMNLYKMPNTVFQCEASGTGAMLIKTSLFDKLQRPYFTFEDQWNGAPTFNPEDFYFCQKARVETKIIAVPNFTITHWGSFTFRHSPSDNTPS